MLPIELSTDLCSLRPQVDRMVLSCVMEIDHQGEVVGYTLNEGVIRSAERMTYTNVNLILEGDPALRAALSPAGRCLRADARAGDDPQPQARAPRLHRLRPARAGHRVRRERPDEEHHALGAQHRQPHHRGVHAVGQRVRGQLPREQGRRPRSIASTRSPIPSGSTTSRPSPRSSDTRSASARCRSSACSSRPSGASAHGTRPAGEDRRDPRRSSHHAAHVSEADPEDRRQAGGAHPVVPDAALAEAGALLRDQRRPLRAGRSDVHALHLADPALSRPHRASHSERRAARIAGARRQRRADRRRRSRAQRDAFTVVETIGSSSRAERSGARGTPTQTRESHAGWSA